MSISPLAFTGVSSFSNDFQSILQRATAIASVPIAQLQNQQQSLLAKKELLTGLNGGVANLGATLTLLGNIGQNKGITASSSNQTKVSASATGAAASGTFVISDITSVAKAASETSASGYATADGTPVSGGATLELVVGSGTYTINLTAEQNNLNGVRDAINNLGGGVSASVLNTGTGGTPYYLSLNATNTGATTVELRQTAGDAGSNILTATNQGANADFKLNGISVSSASNVNTTAIPGATFTILGTTTGTETATIALSSDRTQISNALNTLVTNYNALVQQVNAQVGTGAGVLSGDFLIRQIQNSLRGLASHRTFGNGNVNNIADLGLELSNTGVLSFKQAAFNALSSSDVSAAFTFLGSSTTGLAGLASSFTQLSDPVSGLIKTQQSQYDAVYQRLSSQVTEVTARVSRLQRTVSAKLQSVDSGIARLQSQQSLLQASLTSLSFVSFGKPRD